MQKNEENIVSARRLLLVKEYSFIDFKAIVSFFFAMLLGVVSGYASDLLGGRANIELSRTFHRVGVAIDPFTGSLVGAEVPDVLSVELPVWSAGQGLRQIGGSKIVVGVDACGVLYGVSHQDSGKKNGSWLYASRDEGKTWKTCAVLQSKNNSDTICRINSFGVGTNEIFFASLKDGGLFMSTDHLKSFCKDLIPAWYGRLGPRMSFNGNLLVEQVLGRASKDCRVLVCLYGQRLEDLEKLGCLYVFRTDVTLGQMAAGIIPRLQLAWKQDAFDFYARHVNGAVAVTNRSGAVSATASTFTDAAGCFGANDSTRPRCVRIIGGRGAGQSRMITGNTTNTLSLATPWQVVPDGTSDYKVINGMSSGAGGMHLHCAAWVPKSRNGERNVLFVSFGDKISGHVCRIPDFNQFKTATQSEDYSGLGWNYSDQQVFATANQPTTMWAMGNGQLCFLARDADGATLLTPDDKFQPQFGFRDPFTERGSHYSGTGYDAVVHNGIATVANLVERTVGQYGIFIGNPAVPQHLFRFVRGLNPAISAGYVGFYSVYGNPQSDITVIAGVSSEADHPTHTWLMHQPGLTNVPMILIANAATNLLRNAALKTTNGVTPTGWYQASGNRAVSSMVGTNGTIYGGESYWQIGQTNLTNVTVYAANLLANFPTNQPLCLSYACRLPTPITATYSAPVSLRVEWRDTVKDLRIDSGLGLNQTVTKEWLVEHFSALPPPTATQVIIDFAYRSYCGKLDVALPMATWGRFAAPTATTRSADILEYNAKPADWNGQTKSHVEFLVLPLWPTDVNPYATETICTIMSSDGNRCRLTWDFTKGFQAVFEGQNGRPLATLNLGQLHTLTQFDPCRFSVDCQRGRLMVKLDAGGDVLQDMAAITGITVFNPVKIRLGGNLFNNANLGWEGYYALLACQGAN